MTCIIERVKSKLLRHNIGLYQKTTCIMKPANFKILTSQNCLVSENDLYHGTGQFQNHYVITMTCIKNDLNHETGKI